MRHFLALLVVCAGALAAQEPDAQARRILEQPGYTGYRVERPAQAGDDGWGSDARGSAGGASGGDAQDARGFRRAGRAERRRGYGSRGEGSSLDFSGWEWVGKVLQVLIWISVAIALLAALYFLVRAILGIRFDRRKAAKKTAAKKARAKPAQTAPEAAQAPEPEAPGEFADALAVATREYEEALAQQQWGRATLLAYRIFWLRAGWQGCVEETDVRTWRDALRMVRGAELRKRVRELLRLVEVVRYGAREPGPEEFASWRGELESLNPREALS